MHTCIALFVCVWDDWFSLYFEHAACRMRLVSEPQPFLSQVLRGYRRRARRCDTAAENICIFFHRMMLNREPMVSPMNRRVSCKLMQIMPSINPVFFFHNGTYTCRSVANFKNLRPLFQTICGMSPERNTSFSEAHCDSTYSIVPNVRMAGKDFLSLSCFVE